MMSIGYLICAYLKGLLIEGPLAKLGAEGAGIAFLTYVEEYISDLGIHHIVRDLKFLAQGPHRPQREVSEPQVYSYSTELIMLRIKASEGIHGYKEAQGILSRRYTHRYMIPFVYERICIYGASCDA